MAGSKGKSPRAQDAKILGGAEVVLLRARLAPDDLTRTLKERGAYVRTLPVQKIVLRPEDDPIVRQQLENVRQQDLFIFVSRRAVDWIEQCMPKVLQVCNDKEVFAVGPATAAVLSHHGVRVQWPAREWNTRGLLAMPALAAVAGKKILIFRGRGGLEDLGKQLLQRGALVEYCELYERQTEVAHRAQLLQILQEHATPTDTILVIHSGSVLDAVKELAGRAFDQMQTIPVVVPSDRLRRYAEDNGLKRVHVAASAMPADIENAIVGWYTAGNTG